MSAILCLISVYDKWSVLLTLKTPMRGLGDSNPNLRIDSPVIPIHYTTDPKLEQVKGIEPSSPAWKAGALTIVLHLQVHNYMRSAPDGIRTHNPQIKSLVLSLTLASWSYGGKIPIRQRSSWTRPRASELDLLFVGQIGIEPMTS